MKITGQTASAVFDSIRQQILSGALEPGQLLPPVRDLALQLQMQTQSCHDEIGRIGADLVAGRALLLEQGRSPCRVTDFFGRRGEYSDGGRKGKCGKEGALCHRIIRRRWQGKQPRPPGLQVS